MGAAVGAAVACSMYVAYSAGSTALQGMLPNTDAQDIAAAQLPRANAQIMEQIGVRARALAAAAPALAAEEEALNTEEVISAFPTIEELIKKSM